VKYQIQITLYPRIFSPQFVEYGLYCEQADFPPYVILEFHILINNERLVRGGEGAEHIAPYKENSNF
jgi:hypothetical protein